MEYMRCDLAYLGVASISSMNISFETEPESSAHAASAQEEPTESDIRHHAHHKSGNIANQTHPYAFRVIAPPSFSQKE
jgi:hypothetical protein